MTSTPDLTTSSYSENILSDRVALPKHVAIVMDGNGRWAKSRHKPRLFGHQAGKKSVRKAIDFALKKKIEVLSLFAFGVDNWIRPEEEVSGLMRLFLNTLKAEQKNLNAQQVRLKVIGRRDNIDHKLCQLIEQVEKATQHNAVMTLCVFFNYSGRWDILNANQQLLSQNVAVKEVDEKLFEQYLSTHTLPEVDLLIRTSGEQRVSNFMLWQLAYSELYFTTCFWPDFDENEFQQALNNYALRHRRYGDIS